MFLSYMLCESTNWFPHGGNIGCWRVKLFISCFPSKITLSLSFDASLPELGPIQHEIVQY